MKTFIILLSFITLVLKIEAQALDDEYIPHANETTIHDAIINANKLKAFVLPEIRYFRIKFHIICKSNGSQGLDVTKLPTLVKMLNTAFAPVNIQFFSCASIDFVNDDIVSAYSDFVDSSKNQNWVENRNQSNAVNIYFFKTPGHRGITSSGSWIVMQNDQILVATPHEMGHFFGLDHTFIHGNENVARSGTQCNCGTAGDGFCDTPADPGVIGWSPCIYTRTVVDAYGNTYSPDVHNFMSYYFCEDIVNDGTVLSHFSEQQMEYMSNYADNVNSTSQIIPIQNTTYNSNRTITNSDMEVLRNVSLTNNANIVINACGDILEHDVTIPLGCSLQLN